jgi:outer membrane immunogenic protein
MLARPVLAFAALCGLAAAAQADDLPAPTLPMLALDPPQLNAPGTAPQPSPWSGLTVGSDIFAVSGKGIKGGFGGDGFFGYNHEFANNVIVGIEASAGYAPGFFKQSPVAGYNFASTDVKVGYDMGRFMPYLTAGVTLAKPDILGHNGFTTTSDSVNDLFAGSNPKAFTTVGAGFDYAITNNVSMGVHVSVSSGNGLWGPASAFAAP